MHPTTHKLVVKMYFVLMYVKRVKCSLEKCLTLKGITSVGDLIISF